MSTTADQHIQEFRRRSTEDVIQITTHPDPKTGQRVILWADIQSAIKNAESVWNGTFLVSFLRDENLMEMVPQRIPHHPGVVLEVVVSGYIHELSPLNPVPGVTHVAQGSGQHSPCIQSPTKYTPDISTSSSASSTLTSMENSSGNNSMVMYSGTTSEAPPQYSQSLESVLSAQLSMQTSMHVNLQQTIDRQSDQIQVLQGQLAQSLVLQQQTSDKLSKKQDEIQQLQQQTTTQILQNQSQLVQTQEEIRDMQKVALERLALIQNRIQAVVSQTYELHEYTIPRLFIVLPKHTGTFDKIKNPFSHQFRLYFLCECGSHTMTEYTKTPHHIHLAKHEGYDLEKPNEFFERFGPYVLTVLNMIKYGVTAAGLIVPPLAGLKIVEGIDTAQQHMMHLKNNIAPLVDNTINFLDGIRRNHEMGGEMYSRHTELDQLEALEGADLRQLELYLKVRDQGRVLANLYRIVTLEGHVKWVCFDHYRATYRESAIQELRDIVKVNRGTFIEETGRIEIKIAASILAKQFYDAMVKARGVQDLQITLEWDVTMADLRSLANAVTKANVAQLTVDGTHFKRPTIDIVNRSQRFNPILQLASNSRIQSLRIKGFKDFFSRISKSALTSTPRIRVFSMDLELNLNDKVIQSASHFLEHCSTLTTLELNLYHRNSITKATSEIPSKLYNLESLKITCQETLILAGISKGKIQGVDLTIRELDNLAYDDLKFIQKDHLTRLSIKNISGEADGLADLLRRSPSLGHVRVGCEYQYSVTTLERVISIREKIIQDKGSSSLRTFELMKEDLEPFNTWTCIDANHIESHLSFQDGSKSFTMRTWIHWGGKARKEFVRRYPQSIALYDGGMINDVSLTDILGGIKDATNPMLESLRIRSQSTEANCLKQIIQRSPNFKDFGLYVDLDIDTEFETAQTLLSRHGPILSLLNLCNGNSTERLSWFTSSFPTRHSFPMLESFKLWPHPSLKLPSNFISWVVAMVSAPPQELVPSSRSQSATKSDIDHQKSNVVETGAQDSWTSLKRIGLVRIKLQYEEWRSVIEAIDFSELQILSLWSSNFSITELKLLVNCIPGSVPLRILDIDYTTAAKDPRSTSLLNELRKKVPSLTITTR